MDFSVSFEVDFGSDQDLADIFFTAALDLANPAIYIVKSSSIIDLVGQDDGACSFEVGLRDVAESFLAGSIPDLQFDLGAID